jgi:hypothetical protein
LLLELLDVTLFALSKCPLSQKKVVSDVEARKIRSCGIFAKVRRLQAMMT